MKTLQIGLEWFPEQGGGLDRYYYDCTHYLPQIGVDFQGLVAGSNNVIKDSQGKVRAFAAPDDSVLKRLLGIRQYCKQLIAQQEFDLVVSHFAFYTFPVLNMLDDRPLVFHFHGPWALESGVETKKSVAVRVKKLLEEATYRRAQKFIVLSQTFRDILHQEYQVPLDKISIVPGGADIKRFNISSSKAEARNKLGWHSDRPTIFCVRRLAKRMGLENLINAIANVKKVYPQIMLYIGGKGELATTLQAQIEDKKLENNVKLLGFIPDEELPLCYRAADFSIVPTVALEGFGLIVVESLAAGTPVLGTPIGGIPETLRPFSEDLVLEGFEPKQLARGIIEALKGDRTLPSSEACIDYVAQNYTWNAVAEKIKLVYQSVI